MAAEAESGNSIAQKMKKLLKMSGEEEVHSDGSDGSGAEDLSISMEQLHNSLRDPGELCQAQPQQVTARREKKQKSTSDISEEERALRKQVLVEVEAFSEYLGMKMPEDRDLLYIAVRPVQVSHNLCYILYCLRTLTGHICSLHHR